MSAQSYSSASTATPLATFGMTNGLAKGTQLSSAEPLPIGQYHHAADIPYADPAPAEKPQADTRGASAATQAGSVAATSTAAIGSTTIAAVPVAITGMHKWSGKIIEIDDGIFTAELTPLDHVGPAVLADFELTDLDADDPAAVQEGDLFYLAVRTIRDRGRRVTRTSNLLLRRFGRWSSEEMTASAQEARSQLRALEDHVD